MTQEALAAELGVTAAAVSKRENGVTMPDILMLCALADYFEVITDELLGRTSKKMYAVIALTSPKLGQATKDLVKQYHISTKHICSSYADALSAAKADPSITHLFASFDEPMREEDKSEPPDGLCSIESHASDQQKILDGFELYLRNMPIYDDLCHRKHLTGK